jgi:hypothetical protein
MLAVVLLIAMLSMLTQAATGPPVVEAEKFRNIGEMCQAGLELRSFSLAGQVSPTKVVVDRVGNRILVGDEGERFGALPSLAAYNSETGTQIWRVDLARDFIDLTIDTRRNVAWVLHRHDLNRGPSLTAFDLATGTVSFDLDSRQDASLRIAGGNRFIEYDPVQDRIWIVSTARNIGGPYLEYVDLTDSFFFRVGTIQGTNEYIGEITYNPRLNAVEIGSRKVEEYAGDGSAVAPGYPMGTSASVYDVSLYGNRLIASGSSSGGFFVTVYDQDTKVRLAEYTFPTTPSAGARYTCTSTVIDDKGLLWLACGPQVVIFDLDRERFIGSFGDEQGQLIGSGTGQIVADNQGRIWTVKPDRNRLYQIQVIREPTRIPSSRLVGTVPSFGRASGVTFQYLFSDRDSVGICNTCSVGNVGPCLEAECTAALGAVWNPTLGSGGRCVLRCTGDAGTTGQAACPASAPTCNTNSGLCESVSCNANNLNLCTDSGSCTGAGGAFDTLGTTDTSDDRCIARCTGNAGSSGANACPSTAPTCNPTTGLCQAPSCDSNNLNLCTDSGSCTRAGGAFDTLGTTDTSDDRCIARCTGDAGSSGANACPSTAAVCNPTSGLCERSCTPGTARCQNGNRETCNTEGSAFVSAACNANQQCANGACVDSPTCTEGQVAGSCLCTGDFTVVDGTCRCSSVDIAGVTYQRDVVNGRCDPVLQKIKRGIETNPGLTERLEVIFAAVRCYFSVTCT